MLNSTDQDSADDTSLESDSAFSCVDIVEEDQRWREILGLLPLIENVVAETLTEAELSPETHSVSVALFADKDVQALNREFRGKDTATNVLSFPASQQPYGGGSDEDQIFLGDIALGYETVTSEAKAEGKPLLHHVAHLVAHGVLHLAGFDHEIDEDANDMEAAERAVLAKFGIPDPYLDTAPVSSASADLTSH